MDLDGTDSHSTQYQNANNSVRVTDEFMEAVIDGRDWDLIARTDGSVIRTVAARDLFRQIAHSAWECADPGLQYDTTINRWHTAPNTGRINGSNPCSEYVHLDNSACNLASMNLLTFLDDNDDFDVEGFKAGGRRWSSPAWRSSSATPTTRPRRSARRRGAFRQLGIGYANLGALLMAQGLPYDSDAGRAWAAAITALLTGHAYATSAADRGAHGTVRRLPRERRADAQRAADAPGRGGPHRRGRRAARAALGGPGVLGRRRWSWPRPSACATRRPACWRRPAAWSVARWCRPVAGWCGCARWAIPTARSGRTWVSQVATDEGPRQATKFYRERSRGRGHRGHRTGPPGHRVPPTHRIKVVDPASGEWEWRRFGDVTEGDLVPAGAGLDGGRARRRCRCRPWPTRTGPESTTSRCRAR